MLELIAKTLTDSFRKLCFFIDNIVYSFIPKLYKLIMYLANVDLFSNNLAIKSLINRIYILVGIFMLFKLSFSVINYIVNPDAFSDETKGFSNLIKRVLVAFVLLVSIPWIFSELSKLQSIIIKSGAIPNVILGTSDQPIDDLESSAKDVQFLIFSPFYSINTTSKVTDDNLPDGTFKDCASSDKYPLANIIGSVDMAVGSDGNGSCLTAFAKAMDADTGDVKASGVTLSSFFKTKAGSDDAKDARDFGKLGGLLTWTIDDGAYAINYLPIVSTLCGGYLVFLLLSFCIDIGSRAIKIAVLQVLSPIAVVASVDPSEKSGSSRIGEWAKEVGGVYLSLFIRLATVFVIIQAIKIVTSTVFTDSLTYQNSNLPTDGTMNIFVYVFLILGAFQVGKDLPNILEKATGMKLSGEMNLNPFKNQFVSGMTGGLVGGAVGGLAGAAGAFLTSKESGKGTGRSLVSGLGGLGSGMTRGGLDGLRSKNVGEAAKNGTQMGGRIARNMEVRKATGGWRGMPGMLLDRARYAMGANTEFESLENKAKRYDAVAKETSEMENIARDQLSKHNDGWKIIQAQRTMVEQNLRTNPNYTAEMATHDRNELDRQERTLVANYIDKRTDSSIEMHRRSLAKAARDADMDIDTSAAWNNRDSDGNAIGGGLAESKKMANAAADSIRTSDEYNDAGDRDSAITSASKQAHFKH